MCDRFDKTPSSRHCMGRINMLRGMVACWARTLERVRRPTLPKGGTMRHFVLGSVLTNATQRRSTRGRQSRSRWVLPFMAVAGTQLIVDPAWSAQCRPPRVRVDSGVLEGSRDGDGLERYLGVPYAAPPVGPLRWQPPRAVTPWRGVRPAKDLPPRCAQIGVEGPGSEDCLYLDIFVPERRHKKPLPVVFYVHGGSLRVGSAWDNDPSRIARETNSIVVMVNYRLGMLGFLNHPALDLEAADGVSGNYGLLDQQLALQWVHDQIRAFGGDPHNITLTGMSAGAWSVCAHLTSENMAGTFARAVLHSGDCFTRDVATARATGTTFVETLGCTDESSVSDCIRNKTLDEILATDSWAFEAAIVTGGALLPDPPAERVASGDFTRVPVMFGFTENELRSGAAALFPLPIEDYDFLLNDVFGPAASAVRTLYPPAAHDDPFYAFINAVDDSGLAGTGCRLYDIAAEFATYVPTYVYRFDDATAPNPTWIDPAPGFVAGASHGSDEPYWFDRPFDTLPPLTQPQARLAAEMVRHLGEFAKTGNPDGRGTLRWPAYDARRQRIMRFVPGASAVTRSLPVEDNCAFWSSLGF